MDRRPFNKLLGLATMAEAFASDVDLSSQQAAAVIGEIVLEDSEFLLAFDRTSGAGQQ